MAQRVPCLAVACLAFLALGFQQAPAPAPTPKPVPLALEGVVKSADGKPVEGALVAARSAQAEMLAPSLSTRTDAKGAFRAPIRDGGPFLLRIDAPGWAGVTIEKIAPGSPITVTLSRGGVVQGLVRDGGSGQPLPRATVELRADKAPSPPNEPLAGILSATTDAEGRFRIGSVGSGLHTLTASARGYGRARKGSVVAGGSHELYLFPGATSVAGTVRDALGRPVAGASVRAEAEVSRSIPPRPELTNAEGRFEIVGLDPGEHRLIVRHEGFAPAVGGRLRLDKGDESRADITLDKPGVVSGRLTDSEGRPVAGRISLTQLGGENPPRALLDLFRAEAGSTGSFRVTGLPAGDVELSVLAPGFAAKRVEARVVAGAAVLDLGEILLEPGLGIRGLVRAKTGMPIANARLFAYPARMGMSAPPPETRSEADGSFVIAGLQEGSYRVAVSAAGYGDLNRTFDAGATKAELMLTPAGVVTGTVTDEAGRPIENFRVMATDPQSSSRRSEVSSPTGRFSLEDLAEGTYVVALSAPERITATISGVKVVAGGSNDIGSVKLGAGGVVRGVVTEAGGAPIAGAAISVRGPGMDMMNIAFAPQVVSDTSGGFELRGAPLGAIEVRAVHPDYAPGRVAGVQVDPAAGPAEARVVLSRGARIEGAVRRRDAGSARGQRVMVSPMDQGAAFSANDLAFVNEDGSFVVEHAPVGRIRVTLMAATGMGITNSQYREVQAAEGATTSVTFLLRDILVSGHVTRAGAPASRLRLTARVDGGMIMMMSGPGLSRGGPEHMTALTREDGSYEMIVEQPGRTVISVGTADGKSSFPPRTVEIPDADAHTLDLDFSAPTVSGTVVDKDTNEPIAQADVVAVPKILTGASTGSSRSVSAPDGRFQLELDKGAYRLTVRVPDSEYEVGGADVDVGDGSSEVRIAIGRGSLLRGVVHDTTGRPVPGAFVTAATGESADAPADAFAPTLSDGSFRMKNLRAIPYTLLARTMDGAFALRTAVKPNADEDVVLTLRPGGRARVRVVSAEGQPVEGATVTAIRYRGISIIIAAGTTDAQGFAMLLLPNGVVELRARKEARQGLGTVSITEGALVEAEIRLPPS